MEVLLLEKIEKLGDAGAVVKVADGYARNFLIPRHLALLANQGVIRMAKDVAKNREASEKKILEESQALKSRLESLECQIPVRVGKENKLYGSVTHLDVAQALKKQDILLDRRKIHLEAIKSLGDFKATVKLHSQVEASLKVVVVKA
ncbi:MAG: 50S ribosomal protein L9 [Chlamydiae bacterium]|nr:50S ribosomal protein L9 [Chlamydiota bacterium]MBI3266183.1 50S ribosomal protein L9 [Chlamydiota bacterium]